MRNQFVAVLYKRLSTNKVPASCSHIIVEKIFWTELDGDAPNQRSDTQDAGCKSVAGEEKRE